MKKKITVSTAVTLVILAVALTISITMLFAMRYFNQQIQSVQQRQSMYTHINDVDKTVREYYQDLDEEALRQSITGGYVNGIGDRYTAYFTPEEYEQEKLLISGYANDTGVGVTLDSGGKMVVYRVNQDSAGEKSGVKVGDVVTAVNEQDIADKSVGDVQWLLDNEPKVLLSVSRADATQAFELSPHRYALRSVQSQVRGHIGYVKITGFYENTPDQFKSVVSALLEQGVTGMVFDLRGNAGGLPSAVEEVLSYVMPLGQYGSKTSAKGTLTYLTAKINNQIGVQTATLVDKATAGEAEFFAGVLQEAGLTVVVGETTAGEAKYQDYFRLEADGSAMKLSVGEYKRLKAGSWQDTGIVPEHELVLTAREKALLPLVTPDKDAQYQAALSHLPAK